MVQPQETRDRLAETLGVAVSRSILQASPIEANGRQFDSVSCALTTWSDVTDWVIQRMIAEPGGSE